MCPMCLSLCLRFWRWLFDRSCDWVVVWVFLLFDFLRSFKKKIYYISWILGFIYCFLDGFVKVFFFFFEWHFMVTSNSLFAYEETFLFQIWKLFLVAMKSSTSIFFSFSFLSHMTSMLELGRTLHKYQHRVSIWYNSKAHIPNWQNQNCKASLRAIA